jgi:L-threonylcarbamoyladenylate synthase
MENAQLAYNGRMETKILHANPLLLSKDLQDVVAVLKSGQIAAIPTETVYGLAADLYNERAVQEIFNVKGRPIDNPMIAHIGSLSQLKKLIDEPGELFYHLAMRFWPGPLTLIGKRAAGVPDSVTAGLSTIAVRMPSHPGALQILREFGALAAPSANLSGRPSPTSAADVLEDFNGLIPLVVDGEASSFGIESTVLSLVGERPVLLRPGAIGREILEEFLGMTLGSVGNGDAVLSPGMKYRHYAPKAKIHLVKNELELRFFRERGAYVPSSLTAKNLYAELRAADRLEKEEIAILIDEKISRNEALMNRLEKASR